MKNSPPAAREAAGSDRWDAAATTLAPAERPTAEPAAAAASDGRAGRQAQQRRVTAGFSTDSAAESWTPPSWESIVSTHSARVYRLAYRLTGNQHDAEDLTQEVFVRVFRSLSTYTPGTFEGWLHRITTNLFLDMARRRQRIRFDALADDAAERLPSREAGPAQAYHDSHFDADVQEALDTLAPEFRAAVVLCDIEGLSYEEIAATLGVKLGTVRSRIHRGRSHLRKMLQHRSPDARQSADEAALAMAGVGVGGGAADGGLVAWPAVGSGGTAHTATAGLPGPAPGESALPAAGRGGRVHGAEGTR
ncbi:RNA polymerase sigma-70 factor (ECF subfamily) [Allostreptomyces psammosilenae]|uniref:RNA polymerase sigma-70 factor (ECF subfamily) n=1 Tax=Allostreptomyces psammosilenae TaxID=1892865 RepID=A0A853A0E4_9ACTN|nr:RNA polymerase sigma factor SigE [Allostreptomyces psammosilenae]NYI08093.1 RNA polymerase sigma-70 factor (ECF subfamily) [Allostreptomyces psammosilenae]